MLQKSSKSQTITASSLHTQTHLSSSSHPTATLSSCWWPVPWQGHLVALKSTETLPRWHLGRLNPLLLKGFFIITIIIIIIIIIIIVIIIIIIIIMIII
ncbi:hypothetical protein WISP_42910 [Willisornis vidua]|uniref:Uncharacterized protein n=1 Tax=Willisornis vidua TaxID=1566151 RepID=A0ABQ9DL15_9PASS|nr:hypothetical protein WISP_42910 [Willisornis vidua]